MSLIFNEAMMYDIICIVCNNNDNPKLSEKIVKDSLCRVDCDNARMEPKFPKIICYVSERLSLALYPAFVYTGKRKASPTAIIWCAGENYDIITDGFKQGANPSKNLSKSR